LNAKSFSAIAGTVCGIAVAPLEAVYIAKKTLYGLKSQREEVSLMACFFPLLSGSVFFIHQLKREELGTI